MPLVEVLAACTTVVVCAGVFGGLWYLSKREASRDRVLQTQLVNERYRSAAVSPGADEPQTDLQQLMTLVQDPTIQAAIKGFLNSNPQEPPK